MSESFLENQVQSNSKQIIELSSNLSETSHKLDIIRIQLDKLTEKQEKDHKILNSINSDIALRKYIVTIMSKRWPSILILICMISVISPSLLVFVMSQIFDVDLLMDLIKEI